ncbi:MAG: hypothetical protein DRO73_07810 [Candidatus Thorarchaeota archaeon]|nr:MAG: hypothetical protein DRO73_07810 [Candidatus Thorarchaeota archaeon]RLI62029.1 MAG: hypothetical protein DRO93_02480 [Candidatus Thorarchaeota archaeon]
MLSVIVLVSSPGYYSIVMAPTMNMTVFFGIGVPLIQQHFVPIVRATASTTGPVTARTDREE